MPEPSTVPFQTDPSLLIKFEALVAALVSGSNIVTFCHFFVNDSVKVLVTMTSEVERILATLHQVHPEGSLNFLTGIKVAHVSIQVLTMEESE